MRCIPVVLAAGMNNLFMLVKGVDPELSRFITTGHPKKTEYQTLPDAEIEALERICTKHGLAVTYHSHRIDYMDNRATVTYPQVSNAAAGMKVSLIPWFVLPEHPFPVFVYAYAAWHYRATGGASQQRTAEATGRLFGIESFHKSTVSRNIGMMADLFWASLESPPEFHETPTAQEMAALIPTILESSASIEILVELYGDKVRHMRGRAATAGASPCVMGGIPHEYANVIKAKPPATVGRRRDCRKRRARPRKKRNKGGRPRPATADPAQLGKIRHGFISAIEHIVIGVAIGYHRLLTQPGPMPATTPSIKMCAAQTARGGTKRPAKKHFQ
jgi:hypothetical protein